MPASSCSRTSALLVIDLQRGMFNGERLVPIHDGDRLLTQVQAALQQARRCGAPAIFVRHAGPPGHLLECGSPNWHIHPAIAPAAGENVVDKYTPDSFHETSLMADLGAQGIDQLIVWEPRPKSASTRLAGVRLAWASGSRSCPMLTAHGTIAR